MFLVHEIAENVIYLQWQHLFVSEQAAVFFHFYFWLIKIEEDLLEPDQKYLPLWVYNRLGEKKKNNTQAQPTPNC